MPEYVHTYNERRQYVKDGLERYLLGLDNLPPVVRDHLLAEYSRKIIEHIEAAAVYVAAHGLPVP